MKIFSSTESVFDAALKRINYLFDEFPTVIVGFSGGKDSTVVLNLALKVAEERGRLPLPVVFIDQEGEWDTVIDYIKRVMYDPRVKPYWYQMHFRIYNGTGMKKDNQWLNAWEPGAKWLREKDPISIKVNDYSTDRFGELFGKIIDKDFPGPACYLGGVRTQESPTRALGLTSWSTYKWITWGTVLNKQLKHYTFYPIYDWQISDVWKAIHSNNWEYCKIYDFMYQHGLPISKMRVSNITHENAIKDLYFMQEIEPDTWNRLTARLDGINTAGQLKDDGFVCPKTLPFAFKSWPEYAEYLVENLITDTKAQAEYRKMIKKTVNMFTDPEIMIDGLRVIITCILVGDSWGSKYVKWWVSPEVNTYRKIKAGGNVGGVGVVDALKRYKSLRTKQI